MIQVLMWILLIIPTIALAEANAVNLFPATSISTPGGNAIFTCTQTGGTIQGTQWIVNGSLLQDSSRTDILPQFSSIGTGVGTLTFTNLPSSYNLTSVQCIADLQLGNTAHSNTALILIQDTLSAVGDLSISLQDAFTYFILSWSAPFTLDITATIIDIMYCVDVVNSTSSTLYSECGITETEFSYPTPPGSECEGVTFTVTPVNAAGVGIPNSIVHSQALDSPPVTNGSRSIEVFISSFQSIFQINMTAPVCSANISLVDLNTREEVTLYEADISTQGSTVVFTSQRLTLNRRYHVTITAANINGSAISNIDAISTHDILDVGIDPDYRGIHVQYSVHTRAMGSLLLFMFISSVNREIDFSRSVYLTLDRNSSLDYTLPFQLLSGWYIISAYDIEESGLVQGSIAYPAFTETRFITGNTQNTFSQPTFDPNNCNITVAQELLISILCTDLMATGYHVIVQRNILDNSEVSNLYVNKSSGPHPVTVQVDREGDYHVTVFPINEETGIVGTAVAYSAPLTVTRESGGFTESDVTTNSNLSTIIGVGAGLGVLVLVAGVILAGIFLVVQCRKTKTVNINHENTQVRDLPKGEAPVYEEIGDVMDTFKYTPNILYGMSSKGGVTVPVYEDIKPADLEPEIQIEQCSAYGVNN